MPDTMRAVVVAGMMNRLKKIASQKNGELAGINLVIPIPFG